MSEKAVELLLRAERGGRVVQVRDALKMTGDEFAEAFNRAASLAGLPIVYDKTKVSRIETGSVTYLPAEEAVLIAMLDPEGRGVDWLVLGEERLRKLPKLMTARLKPALTEDRRRGSR